MRREERRGKKRVDGDLRRAAHIRREQDGHLAVTVTRYRARRHDGRHGAAEADEHGNDAAAGQADLAQRLVHHKCDAGHVAGILQNREEEKERHDDRQEHQHTAYARKNAVDDEAMYHRVDAVSGQGMVCHGGKGANADRKPVGQPLPDHMKGEVEYQQHNGKKSRERRIPAGKKPVDLHRAGVLPALVALYHRRCHNAFNEGVAHIGKRCVAVKSRFALHLHDAMLKQLALVPIERQTVGEVIAAFDQLCCAEACRHTDAVGMVGDQVRDGVDAAVDGGIIRAEVRHLGQSFAPSHGDRLIHQLAHALALCGGDRYDRDAERGAHLLHVDGTAVGTDLIHHVQRQHHRYPQLEQLKRQVQIALDVGGVHNVDHAVRLLIEDKIAGDDLLLRIGPQGVDAGQIHHGAAFFICDLAHLLIYRDTGKVADVLVGAGEGVEESRFAAVLISDECKDHFSSPSTSIF